MFTPQVFPPAKIESITQFVSFNLLFILIALVSAFFLWKSKPKILPAFLIAITIADLYLFATGNLITAPKDKFTHKHNFNPGYSRYLSTADIQDYIGLHVYWNHLRVRQPFAPDLTNQELIDFSRLQQETNQYPGNLNLPYRWFNASGYSAVVLQSYAQFLHSNLINSVRFPDINDPIMNDLGINYFVTGYPQDYLSDTPGLTLISESPHIYQSDKTHPRVWFTSGEGSAHIASYLPSLITISTQNSIPDALILNDSLYPGWHAFIDDQPASIHPYKNTFRSVDVPAGSHTVTFSYSPSSVKIGAVLSLVTLAVLIIIFLIPNRIIHRAIKLANQQI